MKKLFAIFALFLMMGLATQLTFAQDTKTEDKENFIKATRSLEEKPFVKGAQNLRSWAIKWASDTKDVTVIICSGTATPLLDKKAEFGGHLLGQYLIGMTAFKLQNSEKAGDENAAQLAGLESMLKSYESMLKEFPKAKTNAIEELLAKRNSGELTKFVADANCGKKNDNK